MSQTQQPDAMDEKEYYLFIARLDLPKAYINKNHYERFCGRFFTVNVDGNFAGGSKRNCSGELAMLAQHSLRALAMRIHCPYASD